MKLWTVASPCLEQGEVHSQFTIEITNFTLFSVLAVIIWTLCVLQEPSDAVNSLSLRIDIGLANPGSSPVLDISSPASVAYSVSMQIYYSEMHGHTHP